MRGGSAAVMGPLGLVWEAAPGLHLPRWPQDSLLRSRFVKAQQRSWHARSLPSALRISDVEGRSDVSQVIELSGQMD